MSKNCALFSLCVWLSASVCALPAHAAEFLTGQAARLVIGQTTFTTQQFGASDTLLGGVGGLAYANGNLWIAGSNREGLTPLNHRVLRMDVTGFPKPLDEIPPNSGRCPVCVGKADLVLGQQNFTDSAFVPGDVQADNFRLPTAVATDGTRLAVADTQNNRVLLWNTLPTQNGQPADVVVGQPDFQTVKTVVVDERSLRAPQGVWIQDNRLYVADTQNHRVLVWNSFPTQNEQPADFVLGQPNFYIAPEPDLTKASIDAEQNTLLNPVSVTSDGSHLFVSDLGHNRVLIWNHIPSQTQEPADVVIGQPDFTHAVSNYASVLCDPLDENRDGMPDTDANGNILYPPRCSRTLDFPRFALSDGQRLFVADGGNDRVLIFNSIPTENAPAPDRILGQPDEFASVVTSTTRTVLTPLLKQSAADVVATPTALAWDGTNLYVTDASNRRVMVFTPGEPLLPINAIRNSASRDIFALGSIGIALGYGYDALGYPQQNKMRDGDTITVHIGDAMYTYTTAKTDTIELIMQTLADEINANGGNSDVLAKYEPSLNVIKLQARIGGLDGNNISIGAVIDPSDAKIVSGASSQFLKGGGDATVIAPGTLITMHAAESQILANIPKSADLNAEVLPLDMSNVQLYVDGMRSPLLYVSQDQINAQMPFEVLGSNNVSVYLRIVRPDGTVIASTPIAVPIDHQNPGIFAADGTEPRPVFAYHYSSRAVGLITLQNFAQEGDIATITVGPTTYSYTVRADDTITTIRDALVQIINADPEAQVIAQRASSRENMANRIVLLSKIPGPAGEGITYSAAPLAGENGSASLAMFVNTSQLCCANVENAPVTALNPAVPGEMIYIFGTGLGPIDPQAAFDTVRTGEKYHGPVINSPRASVDSQVGGATAAFVLTGLEVGAHGIYKIILQLGPSTNVVLNSAQMTISQDIYTSNIVTLPMRDPVQSNYSQ